MEVNLGMIYQELKLIRQELHAIKDNMEPAQFTFNQTLKSELTDEKKEQLFRRTSGSD